MNSVVTTRNLLDAVVKEGSLKRFVNVSSFAVYSNWNMKRETCLTKRASLKVIMLSVTMPMLRQGKAG